MTVKEQALKSISELPSNVSLEDIFDNLLFISKIDRGIAELDAGKGISTEEARELILNA
jgi:predicted transcriptional regulator